MTRCEEIMTDANNLYEGYLKAIDNSKWKESTQQFQMNFLTEIFDLQKDLRNRTLKNGKTVEFELHERGRIRPITSLPIRDRIVRHVLCDKILLPEVRKKIIYDNGASLEHRGKSFSQKRFEIHLRKYYQQYGSEGWILESDFSKFYDNILHDVAKQQLLDLIGPDDYLEWLLDLVFDGFKMDVSYMSDEDFFDYRNIIFNKLEHRKVPHEMLTGEKIMEKSLNIGDQLSQVVGIYYLNEIDTYIKYVRGMKFYDRYNDDWRIIGQSYDELVDILDHVRTVALEKYGVHINEKKTRIHKLTNTQFRFLQTVYLMHDDGTLSKKANKERVTTERQKVKKLANKYHNNDISYECVESQYKGWMGGYRKTMTREQREGMLELYETLFDKKIDIQGHKLIINDAQEANTDYGYTNYESRARGICAAYGC